MDRFWIEMDKPQVKKKKNNKVTKFIIQIIYNA